jgi:DNA-binding transcriptional LysR family regulator
MGPRGVEPVTVSGPIGVDDFSFVREAILAGAGIGLLPAFLCASDVDTGRLSAVLPRFSVRGGALHIVYPSARHLPQHTVLFRDFLTEALAKLRYA